MRISTKDLREVLKVGISLTVEKNENRLLSAIVEKGIDITHCDACTLYMYEDNKLVFRIMKTISKNINRGMDGATITDIPPVPYKEENVCAYTAINRKIINIEDVYDCKEFDFSGPKKYDKINDYRTKSMLVIPLEDNSGELMGVLQLINALDKNDNIIAFDKQYEIIVRSLGSMAAVELSNLRYLKEIKRQMNSFVEAMATAIDERTPYNGTHTRKVAEYAVTLAKKINEKYFLGETEEFFDENRIENIRLAALLHDIGKLIVPRHIMNRSSRMDYEIKDIESRFELLEAYYKIDMLKQLISEEVYKDKVKELSDIKEFIYSIDSIGFLDDDAYDKVQDIAKLYYEKEDGTKIYYITEYERDCLSIRKGTLTDEGRKQMERHVLMTEKILSKVYFNKNYNNVATWASRHHEFLDGSGYPHGLKADELDIETRIITITDIYDALTSQDRPYKQPLSKEKAFSILKNIANDGKIDGVLVDWFEEAMS